jgi:hypothetical protein
VDGNRVKCHLRRRDLGLTPELEELGARRAGLSVIADNRATVRLVSASWCNTPRLYEYVTPS